MRRISRNEVSVAYGSGDSLRASRTLDLLERLPPLRAIPDSFPGRATVFITSEEGQFESLTGGLVPDWSAGVAIPNQGVIILPPPGARVASGWDEARVLRHEWAHLGLQQFLQGLRIPRWFDEGYAEWASGGWSPTEGWRLRVAFALGRAPALDSLILDWPRDRASAQIAYLLSATAVEYLVQESGERGLELFLRRWAEVGDFSQAMRLTYLVTPGQFEEDWKRYVRRRYGWLFVLSHSAVFWLSLALALLVMVRVRRGRNREAMARLRASEPPDQPAFWDRDGKARETKDGRPQS